MNSTQLATTYQTEGGVEIARTTTRLNIDEALEDVLCRIDTHRGAVFASGYEYPGRYSRWDIGFVDRPVELI